MGIVNNLRETNRASPYFNHLTAVSEGIGALGWITVENNPVDFIGDVLGSAEFYGNRVLKEYKERYQSSALGQGSLFLNPDLRLTGIGNMLSGFKLSIESSSLLPPMSNNTIPGV